MTQPEIMPKFVHECSGLVFRIALIRGGIRGLVLVAAERDDEVGRRYVAAESAETVAPTGAQQVDLVGEDQKGDDAGWLGRPTGNDRFLDLIECRPIVVAKTVVVPEQIDVLDRIVSIDEMQVDAGSAVKVLDLIGALERVFHTFQGLALHFAIVLRLMRVRRLLHPGDPDEHVFVSWRSALEVQMSRFAVCQGDVHAVRLPGVWYSVSIGVCQRW